MASLLVPLLLWTGPASASGCDAAEVLDRVQAARAAFFDLDEPGFRAHSEAVVDVVGCLDAPLDPAVVAEVHGVVALKAFFEEDRPRTVAAFSAARAASPSFDPKTWTDRYHPIHDEWEYSGDVEPEAPVPFNEDDGEVLVDGRRAEGRILSQPAVLQRREGGRITESVLWLPPSTVPGWAAAEPPRFAPEVRRRMI